MNPDYAILIERRLLLPHEIGAHLQSPPPPSDPPADVASGWDLAEARAQRCFAVVVDRLDHLRYHCLRNLLRHPRHCCKSGTSSGRAHGGKRLMLSLRIAWQRFANKLALQLAIEGLHEMPYCT
jgi:hypothetical protein